MINLPKFGSYGNYSSSNYGAHCLWFGDAQGNTFWFSYRTLVAFQKLGKRRVVIQNYWGPTTGKHLNWIDYNSKGDGVSQDEFNKLFKEYFGD